MTVMRCWLLLGGAVLAWGCGCDGKPQKTTKTDDKTTVATEDLGGPLDGKPAVSRHAWDETSAAISNHAGKVRILHVWSTWSEELDSEFKELVRAAKVFRDEDVAVLTLATDLFETPEEDAIPQVEEIAKKHEANFEHIIATESDEQLYASKLKIPSTPAVLLYAKDGTVRERFFYDEAAGTPLSYRTDVIPAVQKLLKEEYTAPKKPTKTDEPVEKTKQAAADVPLSVGNWDDVQTLVAKEQGKIVVVDLWSTSCLPCMKEFPHLVTLSESQPDRVACISYNLDYLEGDSIEEVRPGVMDFLAKNKANFSNVMANLDGTKQMDALQIPSIPAIYVYARDGKLAKRFVGEITYEEDVLPLVNSLLADDAGTSKETE